MAIQHTITGLLLPQTRTAAEVLGDMETAVRSILSYNIKPECPECLIARGQLRYAYEPPGRDDYLGWWDWPLVPISDWDRWREHLWEHVDHATISRRNGQPIPAGYVAIDDCDGLSTHTIAWHRSRGRRSWPLVQEFRDRAGKLKGWHALALLELEQQQQHPAELPTQNNTSVMDYPMRAVAEEGKRLMVVDMSWLAGMPRNREGRFNLEALRVKGSKYEQ